MSKKIALLDTSTARKVTWEKNGSQVKIKDSNASPRLLQLIEDGYTVYIVSTRPRLYPEGCDKCLFELIPQDQFFIPKANMDADHARAEGLVDLWKRVLDHFDITVPESTDTYGHSWMELRHVAAEAGFVTR